MRVQIDNNFFSIIIPLYNKVEYIERAIQSIINQTYQNFEIIVVNDGSVDNGGKIVESFCDNRIILINQQNQGVSAARNNGAQFTHYDFLTFLDADDIWLNTFLEEANKLINEYPKAAIYGLNNYFEFPDRRVIYEKYDWLFKGKKTGLITNYFDLFTKMGKSPFSSSNYCIHKNIFQEEGGYKVGIKLTEDSDFWCRIALKYDIAYSTLPLATYYLGTTGSTHFIFEPKDFQVTITLQNALKSNIIKPIHIKSIKKLIAFQQLNLIKRAILTGNRLFALKKILSQYVIYYYTMSLLKCILILIVPSRIVINQRKKRIF